MIFNKRKISNSKFEFNGEDLEIVDKYTYLGFSIIKCGSFISTIKELACKANRAYFALQSSLIKTNINPRIYMKLFDTLIKPIAMDVRSGCIWN